MRSSDGSEKHTGSNAIRTEAGPRYLAGIGAVLLLITCGKWGSYLGLANASLYLTDLLLAAAAVNAVRWLSFATGSKRFISTGLALPNLAPFYLLFSYSTLRLVLSADVSVVALRDAAPYVYSAVALLGAFGYRRSSPLSRGRTIRLLQMGLRIHIIWVLTSVLLPSAAADLPTLDPAGNVRIFSLRPDIDGAMIGTFVGLVLNRVWSGRVYKSDFAFVILGTAEVAIMGNRAGFLAFLSAIVVSVFALVASSATSNHVRARKRLAIMLVPVAAACAVALLSFTPTGAKLEASIGFVTPESDIQLVGIGTQQARMDAWTEVIHYVSTDSTRTLFGVGFGPNFMLDSGAILRLVGSDATDVRSPHNYIVGTLARLGLVGVLLVAALTVAVMRQLANLRAQLVDDELLAFAALIFVSILIASLLGVVLESPFGAVPFFWASGVIMARPSHRPANDQLMTLKMSSRRHQQ
jgi:hypothetical protein